MQETEGGECVCGDHAAGSAKSPKWRLAINFPASAENLESTIHAVEHVPSQGRGKSARFLPIRFIYTDKLSRDDRLLLAFDVLVLSKMLGREVSLGKIIHGHSHAMLNVKTSALAVQVRKHIADIAELLSNPSPPDLILIRHCTECEFQARCRQKAMDKEDLSLLSGMTAKERKKLHDKGIFTVTQLSYTFRPRRRPKRLRDKREKYSHSLRALAIRQKKIHIVGSPEVRIEGTPVYLDVEGLPDRDFYYLIGVRLENHNSVDQYSLWADGVEDERRIWSEFLDILASIKDPILIHYGSYEAVFLKRMANRYGLPTTAPTVSKAVATSVNLLSVVFAQVYFPTFSNSLKDIGHFLSVKWNGPVSSGFQSLAYRLEWERSRRPDLKAALVTYNREDCAAIEAVTSQLSQIISEAKSRTDVEFSDKPKKVASDKGAEIHAAFESVLRSAHFSYARSRIKLSAVKSSQALPPE
jgi:predicted RecB family nuclease